MSNNNIIQDEEDAAPVPMTAVEDVPPPFRIEQHANNNHDDYCHGGKKDNNEKILHEKEECSSKIIVDEKKLNGKRMVATQQAFENDDDDELEDQFVEMMITDPNYNCPSFKDQVRRSEPRWQQQEQHVSDKEEEETGAIFVENTRYNDDDKLHYGNQNLPRSPREQPFHKNQVSLRPTNNRISVDAVTGRAPAASSGPDLPRESTTSAASHSMSILQAKRAIRERHESSEQGDDSNASNAGHGRARNILEAKEEIRSSRHAGRLAVAGIRNDTSNLPAEGEPSTTETELLSGSTGDVSGAILPESDLELPISAEVGGNILAFVAREVVDAIGVTVITDDNSGKDEEQTTQNDTHQKKVRMMRIGLCLLLVVLIVIAVSVATVVGGEGGGSTEVPLATEEASSPSPAPSEEASSPSPAPSISMSPTSAELPPLVNCLSAVTSPEIFQNRKSPQHQAAKWLANEDQYYRMEEEYTIACDNPKFIQRYALATFFFSVGGPQWSGCGQSDLRCSHSPDKLGWLSNSDECDWYMLVCNPNNNMLEEMDMARYMTFPSRLDGTSYKTTFLLLQGSLPPEMSLLTEVVRFSAEKQEFSGTISGTVSTWSKIEELRLGRNDFTGPLPSAMDIKNPALGILDLHENLFTGKLEASIGNLSHLETLQLSKNRLTGGIPSALGSLSNLETLQLDENQLTGGIPSALDSLSNLEILQLDKNRLTGGIPSALGSLSNLETLQLDKNQLTGGIPSALGSLSNLETLQLDENQLTGDIPSALGSLTKLSGLYLNDNMFEGEMPIEIYSLVELSSLYVNDNNALQGTMPTQIGQLQELDYLVMGNTQIGGSFPEELFTLENLLTFDVGNANFAGDLSPDFANLTNLQHLILSNNKFTGSIPDVFHELADLDELALHGNLLTGVISAAVCEIIEIGEDKKSNRYQVQTLTVDCDVDCTCCDAWTECP